MDTFTTAVYYHRAVSDANQIQVHIPEPNEGAHTHNYAGALPSYVRSLRIICIEFYCAKTKHFSHNFNYFCTLFTVQK